MIEIPGYRVLRQLGRGGMATVYLAIQESVDREVALKVMSPTLNSDPTFGERFLREARIAAKLHHRHVVAIYDVGVHRDTHYMAMEYIPGGSIMPRDGGPLALGLVLRCIREIAGALDYAHGKGFIHRDVKPDNILLREDGSSALTDFGIARAADSATVMTQAGSVVGTPFYMSPEQLRGLNVDGRSDLYALGIVLYQLLTGRVPYSASDSMAIGIMHMTAPIPRLPAPFEPLQGLLERMLAKAPEDRVQRGAQVVHEIEAIEQHLGRGRYAKLSASTVAVLPPSTPATRVQPALDSGIGRLRTEPQVGRLEGLRAEPRRYPNTATERRPLPWRKPIVLLTLLVLGVLGYTQRAALWAWWGQLRGGEDRVAALLADAERARAEGRTFGEGGSALALYRAVLALEPTEPRAQAAIASLRSELITAAGRTEPAAIEQAAAALAELQRSFPDAAELPDLVRQLEAARAAARASTPEALLARAIQAERAQRWFDGPDSALALYAQVLGTTPDSAVARDGYATALARADQALERALRQRDGSGAEAVLQQLEAAGARPEELAERRARLTQATLAEGVKAQRIQELLARAEAAFDADRLVGPGNDHAAQHFRAVLAIDPDNASARAGLQRIAERLVERADQALDRDQVDEARRWFAQARDLAPNKARLREFEERLQRAEAAPVASPPEREAEFVAGLEAMRRAIAAGQLLDPPGESAYDRLRGTMAIAPRDPRLSAAEAELADALRQATERALEARQFEQAGYLLDGLQNVRARDGAANRLRERLASLLVAEVRAALAQGDPRRARTHWTQLKDVRPEQAELGELDAALRAAGG